MRVGAVSYLNTKPLVFGLRARAPDIDLVYDLPSRLADNLATGNLDVALIPSIEFLQDPTYVIVSDACIGCRGPVLSVKLLARKPMREIRSLALDEGSRTSAVLAQILLAERFGTRPHLDSLPIGSSVDEIDADAVLLIGDRAINPSVEGFVECWDLGDQWCRWSELPFVFAMWTARAGTDLGDLERAFGEARDDGLANLPLIAAEEAAGVGMSPEATLGYLRDNLYFYLGNRERRGLQLYFQHAAKLGWLPPDVEIDFNDCKTLG